ncbi:MAG: hypothetical protein UD961_15900 [Bacteroidales bacterium]|nr:hypothetical protein [Bacteroidales bacterium]
MKNISIKSGTSATISITPKINGEVATPAQLSGVTIYVFFVYQFTNRVYKEPYKLTSGDTTIFLNPSDTVEMLGNASENQNFEIQFAVKTSDGSVIAEEKDSNIVINITRWEAGQWLQQNKNK